MQIDQCKLDKERGKLGELDANTKVTHILTDLKKLTKSYKNVVGDFKNERSTAEYVIKMVKSCQTSERISENHRSVRGCVFTRGTSYRESRS